MSQKCNFFILQKEHFQENAEIELKIEFQNGQNLVGSCLLWLDYSVNKTHILNLISLQFLLWNVMVLVPIFFYIMFFVNVTAASIPKYMTGLCKSKWPCAVSLAVRSLAGAAHKGSPPRNTAMCAMWLLDPEASAPVQSYTRLARFW